MSGAEPIFDPWDEYVVPPFPLDVLPEDVRRFVETQSRVIGCDPSAVAMSVLGSLQRRARSPLCAEDAAQRRLVRTPAAVGAARRRPEPEEDAGDRGGHTLPWGHEQSLWDEWERERASAHQAAPKAQEPPKPPRYVLHDVTTEKLGEILARQDRGVLVKRDEIAGWIGGMESYTRQQGGLGGPRVLAAGLRRRPVDRGPDQAGEQRIRNLSVSVLGGIQPQRLKELHGLTSDGLLQRFVPVMVGKASFPIDEPTEEALDAYRDLTLALVNAAPDHRHDGGGVCGGRPRRGADCTISSRWAAGCAGLSGVRGKAPRRAREPRADPTPDRGAPHGGARPVEATTVLNAARLVEDFILPHAFEFYRTADSVTDGDRLQQVASWILTSGKTRFVASDFTTNVASFRGLGLMEVNRGGYRPWWPAGGRLHRPMVRSQNHGPSIPPCSSS